MTEFAMEPGDITVPANAPVAFNVTNEGSIEHDFTVEGVGTTDTMASGQSAQLEIPPLDPGSYKVLCTVEGHEPAGMVGTLTVAGTASTAAGHEAGGAAATEPAAEMPMSADEMAKLHEEGVLAFPAKTKGKGNQPLKPELADDGTKVFKLTADEIQWETKPGITKEAMAYNGQVAGAADRRRPGRQGADRVDERTGRAHRAALTRRDPAQRDGRRSRSDAAVDHARRDLQLRIHRAQCRLAHVPLTLQRR